MNITLSADGDLVRKSREYAKAHNTSLNNLIRDYLGKISGQYDLEACANEFSSLAQSASGCSPKDFTFGREALYGR